MGKKLKEYIIEIKNDDSSSTCLSFKRLYNLVQTIRRMEERENHDPFRVLKVYEDNTFRELQL